MTHDPRRTSTSTSTSTSTPHAHVRGDRYGRLMNAYRVALAMARGANALAQQIPRGHRSVADHLLRSSSNAVLLLAEGANRRGPAEKRQRFVESRGEVGEVAAPAISS